MTDTCEYCRLERDDAILTITIDRPEVLNSLHLPAHLELNRAFDLYAADPSLRVAIITGVGERAFCVGTDLKSLADHRRATTIRRAASPASPRASTCGSR